MGDRFIEDWHARVAGAVSDALAYLANAESPPTSDGILCQWLDTLCAMQFRQEDVPRIADLIGKADPHLQEAGVRLARAALRSADIEVLEAPLARLVSSEIDAWVLKALVELLADCRSSLALTAVYQGLAAIHRKPARTWGIMRNAWIDPWKRLVEVYEQNAIQTLRPLARDHAYLPVLERELGTRGWEPTVRHILVRMGFDPDEHFALLRGR